MACADHTGQDSQSHGAGPVLGKFQTPRGASEGAWHLTNSRILLTQTHMLH